MALRRVLGTKRWPFYGRLLTPHALSIGECDAVPLLHLSLPNHASHPLLPAPSHTHTHRAWTPPPLRAVGLVLVALRALYILYLSAGAVAGTSIERKGSTHLRENWRGKQ